MILRTETVTVVFTDLVGSTPLASRLGHEAYEVLRRAHFDALRAAASDLRGDEIKSTGDGLVFAFGSADDAVSCMIRMQQVTDLAARRNGGDPKIRIGASCGQTNRDGNDIFGICVVEAARLCAVAEPEQILVADLVRALVRGLGYKFGASSEFTLKGLPEPVSASTVAWEPRPAPDGSIPLPPKILAVRHLRALRPRRRAGGDRPPLGQGQGGPAPGGAARWRAGDRQDAARHRGGAVGHREGAVVLFGSCDEDVGPALPALRRGAPALRRARARRGARRHVREHQGELLRLVPELGAARARPPAAAGRRGRDRALPAVRGGRRPPRRRLAAEPGRARPRRPALGGRAGAAAAQAPRALGDADAAPRHRHLSRHRICRAPTRSPRCWPTSAGRPGVERLALHGLDEAA